MERVGRLRTSHAHLVGNMAAVTLRKLMRGRANDPSRLHPSLCALSESRRRDRNTIEQGKDIN